MFKGDLLIVDDSQAFCESIVDLLEDENWDVEFVLEGVEAIKKLETSEYKVVLLDLKMPGLSGIEVLNELNKRSLINRNYIIVLTGEITIENAVDSLQYGARDFIQKPAVVEFPDEFVKRIRRGFDWQSERLLNEDLRKERQKAIEESQLIVKSVGHDMSGSYYGSLMLRLQTLKRKISQLHDISGSRVNGLVNPETKQVKQDQLIEEIGKMNDLVNESDERISGIIDLMKFFKELGEKLKHLGNAISIDKSHTKRVDLTNIIKSAIRVYAESKVLENPDVDVKEDFAAEPLYISASEEDLLRVFLNLIENAYKAMEGSGTLTLRSRREGENIIAEVEDTGCGIPEDVIDKIWRPDYTRWKSTTGTGLGLLICRKAVENSGGSITVKSKENVGTTFRLSFKKTES